MADDGIERLLGGNELHFRGFDAETARTGDQPTGAVVTCPGHDVDTQLWPLESSDSVAITKSLGSQIRKIRDGDTCTTPELRVSERLRKAAVVGHTDCTVVKEGYRRYLNNEQAPEGVRLRTQPLLSVVQEADESGVVSAAGTTDSAVHRLVEYNVVRQTSYLSEILGDDATVAGYVHDSRAVYGEPTEEYHLVALDGETKKSALRSGHPDGEQKVSKLL